MNDSAMALPVGLLSSQTMAHLLAFELSIEHSLHHGQIFRDPVEAACILSPLAKGSTPQARFWQATREQAVFARELFRLGWDYERKEAECELLSLEIEGLEAAVVKERRGLRVERRLRANLRMQQANLAQCEFDLSEMRRAAADRAREIVMWAEIKAEAEPHVPDPTCWWAGKEESMASLAVANLLSGRDPVGAVRDLVALGAQTNGDEASLPLQIAKQAAAWWQRVCTPELVSQVLERHLSGIPVLTEAKEEQDG